MNTLFPAPSSPLFFLPPHHGTAQTNSSPIFAGNAWSEVVSPYSPGPPSTSFLVPGPGEILQTHEVALPALGFLKPRPPFLAQKFSHSQHPPKKCHPKTPGKILTRPANTTQKKVDIAHPPNPKKKKRDVQHLPPPPPVFLGGRGIPLLTKPYPQGFDCP